MVSVAGRPLLEHHLHWLRSQGVERAVLLTGYKQEVVREHFATPRIEGLRVECVAEDQPLGRGGALRHGFEQIALTDEVLVATNGDVVTDQPLEPLFRLHHATGALVTLMLTAMQSPYGVVDVSDSGLITGFREKPQLPFWINAGVYLLDRSVMERFPRYGDQEITLFPQLADEGNIAGYRSDAFWRSVETPKDLAEVAAFVGRQLPFTQPTGS
jgi:NDP-sugar pyrophosphorylase family protein